MSIKNYLLENETYGDGLKRALRCWDAQSKQLEQVRAENKRLREALTSIVNDYEHWCNTGKVGDRTDAYADTAIKAMGAGMRENNDES